MGFILERVKDKNPDGSLQIMYTIHGKTLLFGGTVVLRGYPLS